MTIFLDSIVSYPLDRKGLLMWQCSDMGIVLEQSGQVFIYRGRLAARNPEDADISPMSCRSLRCMI